MSAESDGGYSALVTRVGGWWRGGGGDALTLLSNIVLLLCSALHPGPGPSNSEHNTAFDPPAFLMLRNKFSTSDHHARGHVSTGAPHARESFQPTGNPYVQGHTSTSNVHD